MLDIPVMKLYAGYSGYEIFQMPFSDDRRFSSQSLRVISWLVPILAEAFYAKYLGYEFFKGNQSLSSSTSTTEN